MYKENIIVFGGSDLSRLTIDIIKHENKFNIIGIIDDGIEVDEVVGKFKVLGKVEDLNSILSSLKDVTKGIIAIGDNHSRLLVANKIKNINENFSFVSTIHPSSTIGSDVIIGEGSIIAAGVIINNDTTIGKHCYLSMKASISHDSFLGNFSSLGPGATTGGNVQIGFCTMVGIGANILNNKAIGNHSVIGSGCVVIEDIGNQVVAYGVPAKVMRKREKGEKHH